MPARLASRSLPPSAALALLILLGSGFARAQDAPPPNVILIVADDLGYGELGCYGQKKIRTPHIDRLAAEGMRFTQNYAGAPVCAPSRCVLMTGKHLAHAFIRDNREQKPEGQLPIPDGEVTVGELMKERGYATGCVGKWGLGPPGSSGDPNRQGFDLFYGYNCQRVAHNYYPPHLWLNDQKHILDNPHFRAHQKRKKAPDSYDAFYGHQYAPDLMASMALAFIREHEDGPFFLYLPFVEPHLAMQPPQRLVDTYPESWDREPYLGGRGYLPHPRPRAGYAAMITHLDEHVGRVVALVDALGLAERTLILFTSDNGPTHDVGGVDTEFFASAGPLRGRKGSVYEGGLRVPLIARWPGKVARAAVSDHPCAFYDYLPTLVQLAGGAVPAASDGISFLPTLLGRPGQVEHPYLLWEFAGYGGQQAIRSGRWKAVRGQLKKGNREFELYDLESDLAESKDVADRHPEIVERLAAILAQEHSPSAEFPIAALDEGR